MAGKKDIGSWFKAHYDKVLAFFSLILLFVSLMYLVIMVGMIKTIEDQFRGKINIQPLHERAAEVDGTTYQKSLEAIRKPFQLAVTEWTNKQVFVPQKRVWCVICVQPIPYDVKVCPFCTAEQPDEPEDIPSYDGDGDGMWDSWERQYGLNPNDPSDAMQDADGDGFFNIEEFEARTDPRDPESYPPLEKKVYVVEIKADPFLLRFKSVSQLPLRNRIDLPVNAAIKVPEQGVVKLGRRSVLEFASADKMPKGLMSLPEGSTLIGGDLGSVVLPSGSLFRPGRTRDKGGKETDFALKFVEGQEEYETPERSAILVPEVTVMKMAGGAKIRFPNNAVVDLAKDFVIETPEKQVLSLLGWQIRDLPPGLVFWPGTRVGRAVIDARLPDGSVLVREGAEAEEEKLPDRGILSYPYGLSFQLNLRGDVMTYFAKLGEEVQGFKLASFEPKRQKSASGLNMMEDVSLLTLVRGDKTIVLERGRDMHITEYTVTLINTLDQAKHVLKLDQEFELKKGKTYRMIEIDASSGSVVIRRAEDREVFRIQKQREK